MPFMHDGHVPVVENLVAMGVSVIAAPGFLVVVRGRKEGAVSIRRDITVEGTRGQFVPY
jgi:nitrous oxidase accessory protein NosD